MRVLVLSDLYPPDVVGGYELGCRQVADALIARGHEVRVLTSVPRTPAPSPPHVKRTLRLTDVWSNYLYRKSAPVTVRLTESQSHRIDAHNVHALIQELEKRFGPLPEAARQRVQAIDSFQRLVELTSRIATAPSLAALGLS